MSKYIWYSPKQNPDSADTMHQVFAYGTLKDVQDTIARFGLPKAQQLFLRQPKKVYTKPALRLLTTFILRLSEPLDENRYLKTTPRTVR